MLLLFFEVGYDLGISMNQNADISGNPQIRIHELHCDSEKNMKIFWKLKSTIIISECKSQNASGTF